MSHYTPAMANRDEKRRSAINNFCQDGMQRSLIMYGDEEGRTILHNDNR